MMKRIFNIMTAAVAICLAAACQKEEVKDSVNPAIVGEWHLSSVEVDGLVTDYPYDVYLTINSDCTFELYQKSGDQTRYTKYTGTCKSENDTFTGTYSSGAPLNGGPYTATVENGNLVLVSYDGLEVQEYVKEALDEDKKLNANVSTKADGTDPIL